MFHFCRYLLAFSLFFSFLSPLQAEENYYPAEEYDLTGEAYVQSSYNSHWSAYVPIALIVGAAIWFGIADTTSTDSSSHSKDGLGSLASRRKHDSYSSYRSSCRTNSYSSHY